MDKIALLSVKMTCSSAEAEVEVSFQDKKSKFVHADSQ